MHTLQTWTYDFRRQNHPLMHTLFSLRFTFYILFMAQNEKFDSECPIVMQYWSTQPSLVMASKVPLHGSEKEIHEVDTRLSRSSLSCPWEYLAHAKKVE